MEKLNNYFMHGWDGIDGTEKVAFTYSERILLYICMILLRLYIFLFFVSPAPC